MSVFPLHFFSNSPSYEGSRHFADLEFSLSLNHSQHSVFFYYSGSCAVRFMFSTHISLNIKYKNLGRCSTTNTILEDKSVTENDLNHYSHFKRIDTLSFDKSYRTYIDMLTYPCNLKLM